MKHPQKMGLCVELCAQAVRTPLNYTESPPAKFQYDAYATKGNLSATEIHSVQTVESSDRRETTGKAANRTLPFSSGKPPS